jgi:hypothetical protein
VTQLRTFEVEAVPFEIGEHLLYPHPPFVAREGFLSPRQVASHQTWLFFTPLPVQQQVRLVGVQLAQKCSL